jgi:hypothetical protein
VLEEALGNPQERPENDLVAVADLAVDGDPRDACLGGNVFHRRAPNPLTGEACLGGIQDRVVSRERGHATTCSRSCIMYRISGMQAEKR